MQKAIITPELCPHSYSEGSSILYLRTGDPIDKPHYGCLLKTAFDDACTPETDSCPRFRISTHPCPSCFIAGHYTKLRVDEEDNNYVCSECGAQWKDKEEVKAEWHAIKEKIKEK